MMQQNWQWKLRYAIKCFKLIGSLVADSMKLFPEHANDQQRKAHTLETLVPEMGQASEDIEEELAEMEREAQSTLKELQATIGGLSDLRYGRFSKTHGSSGEDLATEVMESLQRIQQLSDGGGKG